MPENPKQANGEKSDSAGLDFIISKRRSIKDAVWHSIEFYCWEHPILNHFLVNRLHNIVQNSTAYKVYPGLRYSRFSHSVGVMHVATQIFVNVVANSNKDALKQLRSESEIFSTQLAPDAIRIISEIIPKSICCPKEFAPLLALVRVGALLHDLGHLPYSHVFEHALENFLHGYHHPAWQPDNTADLRRSLADRIREARKTAPDTKLHELLGEHFGRLLVGEFKQEPTLSVVNGAVDLLYSGKAPATKSLLVSAIDADRIDFVHRDLMFSGLQGCSVDFSRLFLCYELAQFASDGKSDWIARPNRQGISEGEKLLQDRFQDYRNIISHHKVHFFDELLERLIGALLVDGTLSSLLSNLDQLLTKENDDSLISREDQIELLRALLLRFDDPWLDVELRKEYEKARDKRKRGTTTDGEILWLKLFEAYAESRGLFQTVFKRDNEFSERAKHIAPEIFDRQVWPRIKATIGKLKYELEEQVRKELGHLIVIGDMTTKLRHGLKDQQSAEFFGLSALSDHLSRKINEAPVFNIWIAHSDKSKTQKTEDDVLRHVFQSLHKHIQEVLLKQPTLPLREAKAVIK